MQLDKKKYIYISVLMNVYHFFFKQDVMYNASRKLLIRKPWSVFQKY